MARCSRCGRVWQELDDEQGDHPCDCPRNDVHVDDDLHITYIEHGISLVTYWIGTDAEPEQFGVSFSGDYTNTHRDGVVESLLMALAMLPTL